MPSVKHRIEINAPPENVFDLISSVEDFKDYSSLITDIKKLPSGSYLWQVRYLGYTFEWEADITENERPRRFAWRSRSGVFNTGSYTLEAGDRGTDVSFEMEFHLVGHFLDLLASPISSLVSSLSEELLDNLKMRLAPPVKKDSGKPE